MVYKHFFGRKISVTQFFDFLHPEGDKSVYYRAS